MELENMSTAELIALVKRQEQQLTGSVGVTAAELSCVINWLEGGRDPKDAAKELRLYCERAWTGPQPVQQPLPKWIDDQKGSDPNTDVLIEYIEHLRSAQPVQQPAPVASIDTPTFQALLTNFFNAQHAALTGSSVACFGRADESLKKLITHIDAHAAPVAAPVAGQEPVLWYDASTAPHEDHGLLPTSQGEARQIAILGSTKGPFGSYTTPLFAAAVPAASAQPADDLDTALTVFDMGLGFALCHRDFGDTRNAIKKLQADFAAIVAAIKQQPDSGRDAALVAWNKGRAAGIEEAAMLYESKGVEFVASAIRALAAHPANVAQPVSDADNVKHDVANRLALWLSASMDQHSATDEMRKHIRAWLDHQPANVAQVGEEQIITQRDAFRDVADNLANAIAAHFGVDIGEHSSVNCPWDEALRGIEEAGQVGELSNAILSIEARAHGTQEQISLYMRGHSDARKAAAKLALAAAKKGPTT